MLRMEELWGLHKVGVRQGESWYEPRKLMRACYKGSCGEGPNSRGSRGGMLLGGAKQSGPRQCSLLKRSFI